MDMIQMITQGIMSGELQLLAGTVSDTLNDNMQDTPSGPAPSKGN